MFKLLIVACLFISSVTQAGYLTVTGSGSSFEEAKQQAFRKAIEFQVGANVLSDVETQQYKRIKDEIYVYSSGYVDDYKIITQEVNSNIVILLMEVLVSESKIKNRIISAGKSSVDFNNQQHSAQVSTYIQERLAGDRLLSKHLSGYPNRAYTIKQFPYTITINENRNPVLNIPYQLNWNYDYVKTLKEILNATQHGDNGLFKNSASAVVIMVKDPKDWLFGEKSVYKFNDLNTVNQVHDAFNGFNQARIIVRLKDVYSNDLFAICYAPRFISGEGGSFYDTGAPRIKTIFGNEKENSVIKFPVNLDIIDRTSKIELSIDSDFVCKK